MSRNIETQPRSVSQVDQFEKCSWQFKLQRIDRVIPRPAAWSFQGTAFHSAAEELEKSGRAKGEEEIVQLFSDQYSALVNKAMDKEPDLSRWMTAGGKPAGQDIEERYRLGQSQVRDYVRWSKEKKPVISYVKKDGDPVPGLELYFKVELGAWSSAATLTSSSRRTTARSGSGTSRLVRPSLTSSLRLTPWLFGSSSVRRSTAVTGTSARKVGCLVPST